MLIEEIVIAFEMVDRKKAKQDVYYWDKKKTNDHHEHWYELHEYDES